MLHGPINRKKREFGHLRLNSRAVARPKLAGRVRHRRKTLQVHVQLERRRGLTYDRAQTC